MRALAGLAALLLLQAVRVAPEPRHFLYEREVKVAAGAQGRTCAALDADVYAHSDALEDLRLYAGSGEVPYALVTSQAVAANVRVRPLNLGSKGGARGGRVVFDLPMPSRAYSSVDLRVEGQNFLATAKVTGLSDSAQQASAGTALGSYTLFDLTGQRLGRSLQMTLPESSFPFLHVELDAVAAPGFPGFVATSEMVEGAEVPPSRLAQTLYTTVAESSPLLQVNRQTIAHFAVPAHVPVELVEFELVPGDKTNFSREVRVTARARRDAKDNERATPLNEMVYGQISRIRLTEGGREIREEALHVPATLGSTAQDEAEIDVAVENGDDKPLAIRRVRLAMRERKVCFDAPGAALTMRYGDAKLVGPVYDYSRLFQTSEAAGSAVLGREEKNPEYVARVEQRTATDAHPELVWVALIAAVLALGAVAFRAGKRV